MEKLKQEFFNSLDITDDIIEEYIPYILEDLWELGSMPDYIIKLIKENINISNIKKVIDFGCGKGAVLIKLSKEFFFYAEGIDIVPEFIESADKFAKENNASERIKFTTADLKQYIPNSRNYDLVIYGYDSKILGNVKESLLELKKCLSDSGWIILEIAYTPDSKKMIQGLPTETDLISQINESELVIIDKIIWDPEDIKKSNDRNNILISGSIKKLIALHPEKENLFKKYLNNQIEECRIIESDMACSTWLLKK